MHNDIYYMYKRLKYAHILATLRNIEKEKNSKKGIDKSKDMCYN